MKKLPFIRCLILICLWSTILASCSPVPSDPSAPATAVISPLPAAAGQTPAHTPSPSPTAIPAPDPAPVSISAENAGQLIQIAQFGKGEVLSSPSWAPEGLPIYSPDGLRMAVPTAAGIYIHDSLTLVELGRIPVGTPFIAFSPDGRLLAAGGPDAITLWDPAGGEAVGRLAGPPGSIYWNVSFSPDGSTLAAATSTNQVETWSLANEARLQVFPGDRFSFSPGGDLIAVSVYADHRVAVYESASGTETGTWNAKLGGFTPAGLLWLEDAGGVHFANLEQKSLTAPIVGTLPAFSRDGASMALFSGSRVSIYSVQSGRRSQLLEGSFARLDGMLFSPDGGILAAEAYRLRCPTCSEMDGLLRELVLWRVEDGAVIAAIEQTEPGGWLAFSQDGSRLAVLRPESVEVIRPADGSAIGRIDGFTAPVAGMAFAPNTAALAAVYATAPYTLRFWDLETRSVSRTLIGQIDADAETYLAAAFSPRGDYLAVRGDVWDLSAGLLLSEASQAISNLTSCWASAAVFAPAENLLATGCFGGQLDLWHMPEGNLEQRVGVSYTGYVVDAAFSPAGDLLAAVYTAPDSLVQIWQLPAGTPSIVLTGRAFTRTAFSPDGAFLATLAAGESGNPFGAEGGYVQIWEAATGRELLRLDAEDVSSFAFSPDGLHLATGSTDGTLRLWDLEGGSPLFESRMHFGAISGIEFTPDGAEIMTGSLDGTVRVWGLPPVAAENLSDWPRYTSAAFGFSLQYPPGWSLLEIPTPDYPSEIPQVWFTSSTFPPPQTGARADIVLQILPQDPTEDWGAAYFDNYSFETFATGNLAGWRISGINKESGQAETAIMMPMDGFFVLALSNGSAPSLAVFDLVLSTLGQ